jgi:hypothetical protein
MMRKHHEQVSLDDLPRIFMAAWTEFRVIDGNALDVRG